MRKPATTTTKQARGKLQILTILTEILWKRNVPRKGKIFESEMGKRIKRCRESGIVER